VSSLPLGAISESPDGEKAGDRTGVRENAAATIVHDISLLRAILRDDKNAISEALEAGANPNRKFSAQSALTPLHLTCLVGSMEGTSLLLGRGADVHQAALYGWTPLELAVACGHLDIAAALMVHDGTLLQRNTAADMLVHIAAYNGQAFAVAWLLERGYCGYGRDAAGRTPLHYACCKSVSHMTGDAHILVALLLMEAGASPSDADASGTTVSRSCKLSMGNKKLGQFLKEIAPVYAASMETTEIRLCGLAAYRLPEGFSAGSVGRTFRSPAATLSPEGSRRGLAAFRALCSPGPQSSSASAQNLKPELLRTGEERFQFMEDTLIPYRLVQLPNLRTLHLRENALRTFPKVLCNLRRLEVIDVSQNLFSGNLSELRIELKLYFPFLQKVRVEDHFELVR